MTSDNTTLEYYNTKKIEKYAPDANLYFIVGARRIGKTLCMQQKAFELWNQKGLQTMWIRNKKIELSDPSFYGDFLNAPKKFNWCGQDDYADATGVYTADGRQIIKFQSISTFSNRRGNMTADVGMIVFDEFMAEDRRYPNNAHTGLMSLTKTVLSGRQDAKCYCLSNFISCANPYFVGFEIYPKREYDVTYFKDKGIAIEVCRNYKCSIEADNSWNRVYKAGGYADYADETEDSLFTLIDTCKGGQLYHIFLMANGRTYGMYYKDGLYYWQPIQPNTQYVYAPELKYTSDKIGLVPRIFVKNLKDLSEQNVLRFDSPNTMYLVLSMIYNTI